jgi:hypothetical protein
MRIYAVCHMLNGLENTLTLDLFDATPWSSHSMLLASVSCREKSKFAKKIANVA